MVKNIFELFLSVQISNVKYINSIVVTHNIFFVSLQDGKIAWKTFLSKVQDPGLRRV